MGRLIRPSVHTLWSVHKKTKAWRKLCMQRPGICNQWDAKITGSNSTTVVVPRVGLLSPNKECKMLNHAARLLQPTHPQWHTQNAPQRKTQIQQRCCRRCTNSHHIILAPHSIKQPCSVSQKRLMLCAQLTTRCAHAKGIHTTLTPHDAAAGSYTQPDRLTMVFGSWNHAVTHMCNMHQLLAQLATAVHAQLQDVSYCRHAY
jgi:hypothetical protein